ncbi:MAG: DUF962 domain-containing protein [Cognaticolwellia sp.]
MRSIEEQLSNYKSVHFNKTNIKTHFVGIPLIVWAITVLLSLNTFTLNLAGTHLTLTPAMVLFAIALLYYLKLNLKLALGMLAYIMVNLYLASFVSPMESALWIAIAAFVLGWIIQFIGHIYEKAKPAFFDDIMGLVIGPLFLMAEVYFALGFAKKLDEDITPMAIEKRRLIERNKN